MNKLCVLFLLFIFYNASYSQAFYKSSFILHDKSISSGPFEGRLDGNGIVDLLVRDSVVWAATGYGLNKTTNEGIYWDTYYPEHYIGKGGVSAMAYMQDDSTLWIATAYDTTALEEDLPAGGGLSYTRDGGRTWEHIPQPIDSVGETEYSPTTTNIQNLTYDIAFIDSTIWIASYGGGLRRSDDMGKNWQVVTTDGKPFSSLKYLNHRAFSLLSENGNLWIGTAEGISKSNDNGKTWQRFTHYNQEYPISANFIVALGYQEYNQTVWAATIEATDTSETRAVSKTANGGQSWEVVLPGTFVHNFAFDGARIYVAADEGILLSDDDGETWYKVPNIRDYLTDEEILRDEFYSVAVQKIDPDTTILWLGSTDGIATTKDNGNTWSVIKSFISTTTRKSPIVYPCPSPFSPGRHEKMYFRFDIDKTADVVLKIYDFSMTKVFSKRTTCIFYTGKTHDRAIEWDGRNNAGKNVASGVYFFRTEIDGKVTWGKLVVIN